MRNIILVMRNNLYRFMKDKVMLAMVIVVMPIIICLGVYFNSTNSIKGTVAVVGTTVQEKDMIKNSMKDSDKIKIEFLEKSPTKTDLIKGIYIAEINLEGDKPIVTSYGKDEIKKTLEAVLEGKVYEGKGTNETVQGKVIGFLVMFLFLGSATMIMDFFVSDRENGTYTRVLSGKINYYEYILGQMLYSIVILSIPSTIWSVILLKVLNVNLDISYSLFIFILLLVGVLSSSFGMFIATIFKSRAAVSMGGSIVAMITCLLGGCLINIVDSNKIIGFIRNILPQKHVIDLANNFNNGDLIFTISYILAFVAISVVLGRIQYENGDFVV